jgi:hypothetical protein
MPALKVFIFGAKPGFFSKLSRNVACPEILAIAN